MTAADSRRIIAHVDLDSFYASAEIRRNQSLKDEPVIIGADPKEGKGRGVVLTCNYVARKYGVHSGMSISRAWTLCPDAKYIRPDFDYYEILSAKVMQTIRGKVGKFEQVSIDEAFVDISEVRDQDVERWVNGLKAELLATTGLTCSVGVAVNKSTAKIASDFHKPDGVTIVPAEKTKEFLASLPVKSISGVGVKTEIVLNETGIRTIGDLQRRDQDSLRRRLGKVGLWLWSVAQGIENEDVQEHEIRSLSTERTFAEDTADWTLIDQAVLELTAELASRTSAAHFRFKRVGVKIRFHGFETHTRESTLSSPASERTIIEREALKLLKEFRSDRRRIRLVGLRVSGLEREAPDQTNITTWIEEKDEGDGSPPPL